MGRKVVSGHSGFTGRVFINGSELCVEEQNWTEMAEEENVTNSCSAGFEQYEYGNRHVEGSVKGTWDVAANPFDDPPQLRAGGEYSVRLYIHSAPGVGNQNGPNLFMGSCKFNDIKITVPAKGKVMYDFNFKSNGQYSLPTGSESSSGAA